MNYPAFGPCLYCGEPMILYFHLGSLILGGVAGVIFAIVWWLVA